MDGFIRALETGHAQRYQQENPAAEPQKRGFRQWLVKKLGFKGAGKQPAPIFTVSSVAKTLTDDFGDVITRKVMPTKHGKPLSARRVASLHKQASKVQARIHKDNSRHIKGWCNLNNPRSLLSQVFQDKHGYPAKKLPDYEKSRLTERMTAALFHQSGGHTLSKPEACQLAANVVLQHGTGLAEVAGNTMKALGANPAFTYRVLEDVQSALPENDGHLVETFANLSDETARQQWISPFDSLNRRDWANQLAPALRHGSFLREAARKLRESTDSQIAPGVRKAMIEDLDSQVQKADQYVAFVQSLAGADFRNQGTMKKAKRDTLNTALLMLEETGLVKDPSNQSPKAIKVRQLHEKLTTMCEQEVYSEPPVYMKKAIKKQIKEVKALLKEAGMSSREINKGWRKALAATVNKSHWETIDKTIPVRAGGQIHNYRSQQIPANEMRLLLNNEQGIRDPFPVSYHGTGRTSANLKERVHTINMYETRLDSANGRELYSGIRTGTLYPKGEKNKAKVQSILESRSRELVTAALVKKLSALSPEQRQKVIESGEMSFDMVSTSLVSPDYMRHAFHVHDDELTFQLSQNNALTDLCREPVVLVVFDSSGRSHVVEANVRFAALNIPVNKLGLHPVADTIGYTCDNADELSAEGYEVLMGNSHPDCDIGGIVGSWLRGEGLHSPNRNKVLQLVQQIRHMHLHKLHHREGQDAFKMATRVQLLAHMVGAVGHFNCKSGKDRTGEADSRLKVLASEVDRLGYVPDPTAPIVREHREAVQGFIYGAGSMEVQQQNILLPGYKTALGKKEQGDALYSLIH